MGAGSLVVKVNSKKNKKDYAIKVVNKSNLTCKSAYKRLKNEIDVHLELKHKNIVQMRKSFEDEGNIYLIMEFCEGGDLFHFHKHHKKLLEKEVRRISYELAEGIKYLHDKHIIHRDLKLGNVLLTGDHTVKICDFGLAARLDGDEHEKNTICGTPNYISPEILNKQPYGMKIDIWSFGCVLYALATGQPPFQGQDVVQTLNKVTNKDHLEFPSQISPVLKDLLVNTINWNQDARFSIDQIMEHPFYAEIRQKTKINKEADESLSFFNSVRSVKGDEQKQQNVHQSISTADAKYQDNFFSQLEQNNGILPKKSCSPPVNKQGRSNVINKQNMSKHSKGSVMEEDQEIKDLYPNKGGALPPRKRSPFSVENQINSSVETEQKQVRLIPDNKQRKQSPINNISERDIQANDKGMKGCKIQNDKFSKDEKEGIILRTENRENIEKQEKGLGQPPRSMYTQLQDRHLHNPQQGSIIKGRVSSDIKNTFFANMKQMKSQQKQSSQDNINYEGEENVKQVLNNNGMPFSQEQMNQVREKNQNRSNSPINQINNSTSGNSYVREVSPQMMNSKVFTSPRQNVQASRSGNTSYMSQQSQQTDRMQKLKQLKDVNRFSPPHISNGIRPGNMPGQNYTSTSVTSLSHQNPVSFETKNTGAFVHQPFKRVMETSDQGFYKTPTQLHTQGEGEFTKREMLHQESFQNKGTDLFTNFQNNGQVSHTQQQRLGSNQNQPVQQRSLEKKQRSEIPVQSMMRQSDVHSSRPSDTNKVKGNILRSPDINNVLNIDSNKRRTDSNKILRSDANNMRQDSINLFQPDVNNMQQQEANMLNRKDANSVRSTQNFVRSDVMLQVDENTPRPQNGLTNKQQGFKVYTDQKRRQDSNCQKENNLIRDDKRVWQEDNRQRLDINGEKSSDGSVIGYENEQQQIERNNCKAMRNSGDYGKQISPTVYSQRDKKKSQISESSVISVGTVGYQNYANHEKTSKYSKIRVDTQLNCDLSPSIEQLSTQPPPQNLQKSSSQVKINIDLPSDHSSSRISNNNGIQKGNSSVRQQANNMAMIQQNTLITYSSQSTTARQMGDRGEKKNISNTNAFSSQKQYITNHQVFESQQNNNGNNNITGQNNGNNNNNGQNGNNNNNGNKMNSFASPQHHVKSSSNTNKIVTDKKQYYQFNPSQINKSISRTQDDLSKTSEHFSKISVDTYYEDSSPQSIHPSLIDLKSQHNDHISNQSQQISHQISQSNYQYNQPQQPPQYQQKQLQHQKTLQNQQTIVQQQNPSQKQYPQNMQNNNLQTQYEQPQQIIQYPHSSVSSKQLSVAQSLQVQTLRYAAGAHSNVHMNPSMRFSGLQENPETPSQFSKHCSGDQNMFSAYLNLHHNQSGHPTETPSSQKDGMKMKKRTHKIASADSTASTNASSHLLLLHKQQNIISNQNNIQNNHQPPLTQLKNSSIISPDSNFTSPNQDVKSKSRINNYCKTEVNESEQSQKVYTTHGLEYYESPRINNMSKVLSPDRKPEQHTMNSTASKTTLQMQTLVSGNSNILSKESSTGKSSSSQNPSKNRRLSPLQIGKLMLNKISTHYGTIEITENRQFILQPMQKNLTMIISPDGKEVTIVKEEQSQNKRYLLDKLPDKYVSLYDYCKKVCRTLQLERTPQVKIENQDGLFILYENKFEGMYRNGCIINYRINSQFLEIKNSKHAPKIDFDLKDIKHANQDIKALVEKTLQIIKTITAMKS